jgi:hypothetical protein
VDPVLALIQQWRISDCPSTHSVNTDSAERLYSRCSNAPSRSSRPQDKMAPWLPVRLALGSHFTVSVVPGRVNCCLSSPAQSDLLPDPTELIIMSFCLTALRVIQLLLSLSCLRLCGLVVRVPGYTTEMYCVCCEVRTEFIYVM